MDSMVSTRELVEAVNSYNDVTLLDSAGSNTCILLRQNDY